MERSSGGHPRFSFWSSEELPRMTNHPGLSGTVLALALKVSCFRKPFSPRQTWMADQPQFTLTLILKPSIKPTQYLIQLSNLPPPRCLPEPQVNLLWRKISLRNSNLLCNCHSQCPIFNKK